MRINRHLAAVAFAVCVGAATWNGSALAAEGQSVSGQSQAESNIPKEYNLFPVALSMDRSQSMQEAQLEELWGSQIFLIKTFNPLVRRIQDKAAGTTTVAYGTSGFTTKGLAVFAAAPFVQADLHMGWSDYAAGESDSYLKRFYQEVPSMYFSTLKILIGEEEALKAVAQLKKYGDPAKERGKWVSVTLDRAASYATQGTLTVIDNNGKPLQKVYDPNCQVGDGICDLPEITGVTDYGRSYRIFIPEEDLTDIRVVVE